MSGHGAARDGGLWDGVQVVARDGTEPPTRGLWDRTPRRYAQPARRTKPDPGQTSSYSLKKPLFSW
jgi:hypothetical protein